MHPCSEGQHACPSGLANPAPIISTFLLEPSLAQSVRLDGICTVVDAKHVSGHLDRRDEEKEDNEASAQLAYADRILLNKTDLVSEEELLALTGRIRNMNRLATIQPSQRSRVPVDYVLGIGGYALEEISATVCSHSIMVNLSCFVVDPTDVSAARDNLGLPKPRKAC